MKTYISPYQQDRPSALAVRDFYSLIYLSLELSRFLCKGAYSEHVRLSGIGYRKSLLQNL